MVKNSSPSPLRLRLEIGDASKRGGGSQHAGLSRTAGEEKGRRSGPKVVMKSLFVFKSQRKRNNFFANEIPLRYL
jgi:hypothetical protein